MDQKRCKTGRRYITTKKVRKYASVDRQHKKYAAETRMVCAGWVMQLPTFLLYEILSRLSVETLMSCRCVCKMFREILADPYFAELHLLKAHRLDQSLIFQKFFCPSGFSLAYVSDLENPSVFPCRNSSPWRYFTLSSVVSQAKQPFSVSLAGSCNGLLCFFYYTKGVTEFYVCNPFLGEFMHLPQNRTEMIRVGAFGFCPKTKKYKVIRFVTATYCEIHTLGTNYWRRIENVPYPDNPKSMDSSLNGNLHWVTTSPSISYMICALNLETEQFHYIYPPPHFSHEDTIRRISYMSMKVGVIHGLFCVFYLLDEAQREVCVMKEYGVAASWKKEFTVNLRFKSLRPSIDIKPRRLLNNGDLLIFYNGTIPVYYSSRKGIFREVMSPESYDVVVHAPSFISLKNIAGENDVEVVRYEGTRRDVNVIVPWVLEEDIRLGNYVGKNRTVTNRVSWGRVAREMGDRTPTQCRSRWNYINARGLLRLV